MGVLRPDEHVVFTGMLTQFRLINIWRRQKTFKLSKPIAQQLEIKTLGDIKPT
jgi:hypothetical protein